jgi:hypothetical protein
MKRTITTIQTAVIFAGAFSLVACGPGAKIGNGKQGAAEALFAAGQPAATSMGNTNTQPVNFTLTGDTSIACRFGGSAALKAFSIVTDTGSSGVTSGAKFTLEYDHCGAVQSSAGTAIYDGSFDVTQSVATASDSVAIIQTFKGKVTVGGAFDDFLQADVSENVATSALTATSGGVSVNLVGTLADSSGSYDFNESVSVTAGNLSVQVTKQ